MSDLDALITRMIRAGRGPFRDTTVGGVHVHHHADGILLLLGTGALEFTYNPTEGHRSPTPSCWRPSSASCCCDTGAGR